MASVRQLLPAAALFLVSCGSAENAAVDNGAASGPGSTRASAGSMSAATTNATVGNEASNGSGSTGAGFLSDATTGGSSTRGETPALVEGSCEAVDAPELLPEVTLPQDECVELPVETPPGSPEGCLLWTGAGYLSAHSDPSGIVVILLDAEGLSVSEEILSIEAVDGVSTHLSRNGDHVLVVVQASEPAAAVLNLRGAPLTQLSRLSGPDHARPFNLAVMPSGDGWLVAFGYSTIPGARGLLISSIAPDGVVRKQHHIGVGGYLTLSGFSATANGEVALAGEYYSGGAYGSDYALVALMDHELDAVSCRDAELAREE